MSYPLLSNESAPAPVLNAVGTQVAPSAPVLGVPVGLEMGGFTLWQPDPSVGAPVQQAMGVVGPATPTFQIIGSEYSQILEVQLPPGQTVTAEPGTMLHMTAGMGLEADMGGCGQACKRSCCAGESFFRLHLQNKSNQVESIGVTPRFPAKIVPLHLADHSGLIINRGAFLAALGTEWKVNLKNVGSFGVCCCGGQGLFMNTLHGQDMVFLNAGGTVLTKSLADGEQIVVDHHSILAFASTVELGIRRAGGCMVCCCAQQGLFNATLTGPGFVMLHSMALSKLRGAVGTAVSGQRGANAGGDS